MQHSLTKQNSRVWLPYVLVEATTNYSVKSSLDLLEILFLWRMKSRMEILNQKLSKTHGIEFQVLSFFLFGVLHLEQLATKLTSQLQRFAVRDAPSQKTAT